MKWLAASIQRVEPDVDLTIRTFPLRGDADFQSLAFKTHNRQKNRQLVNWIREHDGKLIFVTDADVVYYRPFLSALQEEAGNADLALAAETMAGGYNIGQMVVRCSERLVQFFEAVGEELDRGAWDQEAINRLLPASGLRHKSLSTRFANSAIWDALNTTAKREILSYHATGTEPRDGKSSLELKQMRFETVQAEWTELNDLVGRNRSMH